MEEKNISDSNPNLEQNLKDDFDNLDSTWEPDIKDFQKSEEINTNDFNSIENSEEETKEVIYNKSFYNSLQLISPDKEEENKQSEEKIKIDAENHKLLKEDKNILYNNNIEYNNSYKLDEKTEEAKIKRSIFLETKRFAVECLEESINEKTKTSSNKEHIRTYNKEAPMPKISYGKAYVENKSFLQKSIPFIIISLIAGIFFANKANVYYTCYGNSNTDFMGCLIGWMMQENLPTAVSSFYPEIFFPSFLVSTGIAMCICLFILLDQEQNQLSRVGHEHGNSHLATKRDFQIYKKKFME